MAVVNYSIENPEKGKLVVTWANLANGDSGSPFVMPSSLNDVSAQIFGTFGVGGTVLMEGTNESSPANWATLNDPQGNPLSVTSAKIEELLELVNYIRPRVSAGDGTTSITIKMLLVV